MTDKRVVFLHPDGLEQILGIWPADKPQSAANFPDMRGRIVPFASLVRVTARAAYFKEPMLPGSYTFHEAQR